MILRFLTVAAFLGLVCSCGSQNADSPRVGRATDEYEFVLDTDQFVLVNRTAGRFSIGKLDPAGNFVPDKRWLMLEPGAVSGVPPTKGITLRGPAYEYRSGRLVKGELDEDGNFLPEIGSKVLDFKDYRYSDKALRIYNLPGYFKHK